MNDIDTACQTLVSKLKAGDRVYTGHDHPMQLTAVDHLGGGLVILHGPAGIQVRKDSREVMYVAR